MPPTNRTHPQMGQPEFLVDEGSYNDRYNLVTLGSKYYLLNYISYNLQKTF